MRAEVMASLVDQVHVQAASGDKTQVLDQKRPTTISGKSYEPSQCRAELPKTKREFGLQDHTRTKKDRGTHRQNSLRTMYFLNLWSNLTPAKQLSASWQSHLGMPRDASKVGVPAGVCCKHVPGCLGSSCLRSASSLSSLFHWPVARLHKDQLMAVWRSEEGQSWPSRKRKTTRTKKSTDAEALLPFNHLSLASFAQQAFAFPLTRSFRGHVLQHARVLFWSRSRCPPIAWPWSPFIFCLLALRRSEDQGLLHDLIMDDSFRALQARNASSTARKDKAFLKLRHWSNKLFETVFDPDETPSWLTPSWKLDVHDDLSQNGRVRFIQSSSACGPVTFTVLLPTAPFRALLAELQVVPSSSAFSPRHVGTHSPGRSYVV